MRNYLVLGLVLSLFCPAVAQSGNWRYDRSSDGMGRGEIKTARLQSANTVTFGSPYGGPQRAVLVLRAHPRYGRDVYVDLDRSQFLCRIDGCSVLVRFDDAAPVRYSATEPADHSSNTLFIRGYDRFVAAMMKAKRVRIEAAFYREGNRLLEFDLAGYDPYFLDPGAPKSKARQEEGREARRQRLIGCNEQADSEMLSGAARKKFIAECAGG